MLAFTQEYTGPVGLDRIPNFDYVDQLRDHQYDLNDPLLLIQVANDLIPLGTREAMRRLDKYAKTPRNWYSEDFPFWLARILFVGKKPGYFFPYPQIGAIGPSPPKDISTWPTYPLVEVSGIPFNLFESCMLAGHAEEFYCNRNEWTVRAHKLVPPDDPFPFDRRPSKWNITVSRTRYTEQARAEILRLVRTAYRLDRSMLEYTRTDKDYERAHQDFLRLGCHWNPYLNMYVRGDGTYDLDVIKDKSPDNLSYRR